MDMQRWIDGQIDGHAEMDRWTDADRQTCRDRETDGQIGRH